MGKDTDDGNKVFKTRVTAARETRGLTQQQLAEMAGLPSSSISHFESGARKPSFDYLLGRVDDSKSIGAADQIHRHLSNISTSDLELADNFLKMLAERNKKQQEK
jgi:predicted transcriptional regulator